MTQIKMKIIYIAAVILLLGGSNYSNGKNNLKQKGVIAINASDFLNSIGAVSSVTRRGETLEGTIDALKYTGLRWLRAGYEDNAPISDFLEVHKQTGVLFSYGLLSGHSDIQRLLNGSRQLSEKGALLALEGSNEPNNWSLEYNGEVGGHDKSWIPVAKLHRDLYAAAKNDPVLKNYPVWATTEMGAEIDNVGLQFLTIPEGVNTLMPEGTKYADYANCHNYVSHPSWPGLHDNQTWLSSSPGKDCPVDGLYGNFGLTWRNKFQGYSEDELLTLPKVTTETGYAVNEKDGVDEEIQARLYLNLYLSQYKRGWKYTAVYLLKGRANEPEHEAFAFYTLDYKPKQAAHYMHNFTTILADNKKIDSPEKFDYSIPNQPSTTHDLLLQKSNGRFYLVLWGEKFASKIADNIKIELGKNYKTVNIYDPTTGTNIVKELKNVSTVDISLTDHPVVLEIQK